MIGCTSNEFISTDVWESEFIKDTSIHDIELVYIPQGPYKSGLKCNQDSIPYNYWIGKYEITNAQFYKFIQEALHQNVLTIENGILQYFFEGDDITPAQKLRVKMFDKAIYLEDNEVILDTNYSDHPVISITYYGALAFCKYYGFDLPTESEWIKAARGNLCIWYPWGNDIDKNHANYLDKNSNHSSTTPVGFYDGTLRENIQTYNAVSVYGCYDMAGNAWEWTKDRFSDHQPYTLGKGGGYNLHTAAQLQIYYVSTFGVLELAPTIDLTHLPDGFRVIKRINNHE